MECLRTVSLYHNLLLFSNQISHLRVRRVSLIPKRFDKLEVTLIMSEIGQ